MEYCTLPKFGSPEEELSFHRWNDRKKLKQRKYFLLLAIVTYTLFGALDPLTGGAAADEMLAIRSLTCLFLTVIWVGFLRAHDFERRELCVFLFGFTTMASLLWIILIADQPAANYYPFSFGVVMIFGTTLIVPRFSTVAALAIGCFIAYWAAVPWAKTSIDAMLVNAFLMSVTTCSIVVGAFAREKLEREAAITNLKLARTRSEAIEMRDAALRANHAKSHFLANVSHELRTPMNAILGFSEVMRDGIFGPVTPSRYAEYVDNIHFSGSLLLANINDLLDFSRIELNKLGWSEKPFQVGEVMGIAIATCEAGFEDATIRFTDRTGRRHARMMGDEGRLSQAIINIVGNAIKFSPPGVPVEVSFEPHEKGGAVLHVRDRGCGIPPSDLERIREPFGQVNADSYSAQKGGLGLGLAITGEIVNRLQGELLIESEPGVGTCVSILLPAARFMQAEAAAA